MDKAYRCNAGMSRAKLAHTSAETLRVCNLSETLVPYASGLKLQNKVVEEISSKQAPDSLIILQHSPVFTTGKRGGPKDFRTSPENLKALGADVVQIGRGGETTHHGPGQLVMYPVINLRRLRIGARAFVEGLEDSIIDALQYYGVKAQGRQPGRTGVWVEDRKIAAIGVQISKGTCTHGLAVNVANDLSWFDHIIPCGILDKSVTSLEKETATSVSISEVSKLVSKSLIRQFGYKHTVETSSAGL